MNDESKKELKRNFSLCFWSSDSYQHQRYCITGAYFFLAIVVSRFFSLRKSAGDGSIQSVSIPLCTQKSLTCNFHLPTAAILLTAGSNWLLFHGNDVVVFFLRLHFLDVVVVAKLRQLSFEVFVLCNGVKSLDVVNTVDFRHFVTRHRLPLVVALEFGRFSELKVEFPLRFGF